MTAWRRIAALFLFAGLLQLVLGAGAAAAKDKLRVGITLHP